MSLNEWKNRTTKNPEVDARLDFAAEAKEKNCWIYNLTEKKWFTPEEFAHSDQYVKVHRGKTDTRHLQIIDPRVMIDKIIEEDRQRAEYLQNFMKKVWSYYDIKRKA